MASTDAIINVIVNGQQRVEQLISKTNELNSLIEDIKRSPLDLTFGSSSSNQRDLNALNSQLNNTRRQLENTRSEIASGIQRMGEYRQAVQSSREALNGLSLGTVAYSRAQRQLTAAETAFDAQSAAVQRLERSLTGLQRREASEFGQVRRAEALREQIRFAEQLANSYIDVEVASRRAAGGIENMTSRRSSAVLKSEIAFFDTLANNVNFASKAFRRFSVASASAGIAAGEGSRRRFSVLAEAFAPDTRGLTGYGRMLSSEQRGAQNQANLEVQNLINAYPEVARSKAGLQDYKGQLQAVLDLVPAGTSNFIQLSNAIRQVDEELERFGNVARQAGPQQFISVRPSGPVSDRLNSLKQQQQYAVAVNKEYTRQTDLAEKILASSLSQVDKDRLNLQLNQSLDNLAEHRLEVSEMMTTEIEKQFKIQERLLRLRPEEGRITTRPQTQTFGLVGTSFMPITGKLPSGEVIPGSPTDVAQKAKTSMGWNLAIGSLGDLAKELQNIANVKGNTLKMNWSTSLAAMSDLAGELNKTKASKEASIKMSWNTSIASLGDLAKELKRNAETKGAAVSMNWNLALAEMGDAAKEIQQNRKGRIQMNWNTALAGGQELLQENRVNAAKKAQEEAAAATEKLSSLWRQLNTLQKNYTINEERGVKFLDEKAELTEEINRMASGVVQGTKEEVDNYSKLLSRSRELLAMRISEAKVAGTYKPAANAKPLTAEQVETRRSNLLNSALSLQSRITSIEGAGVDIAAEKLELETKIARLKQIQGNATTEELRTLLQEIQQIRIKAKEIQNTIPKEARQVPFLERKFADPNSFLNRGPLGRMMGRIPGGAAGKAFAVSEGLVGGAFPLLFGQGLGASLGGGLGGIAGGLAGGGLGFGLSLLGTTIGSFLDTAVAAAQKLGNAILIAGDNAKELRQQGLYYTADLQTQVELLKRQGQYAEAQRVQTGAVTMMTGDIGGMNTKAATAGTNELLKAWQGVQAAVGNTLATLAAPFLFVLAAVLRVIQGIFFVVNLITSGISSILNLIPGVRKVSEEWLEKSIEGTAEYENQLAELNKQIEANQVNNKILKDKNTIIQASLLGSKSDYELAVKKAEANQRVAELQKQISDFRATAPTGTAALRERAAITESQMRAKFIEEERAQAMSNARSLYDEILQNNKRIAEAQKQYQREYADLVRQTARQQEDLNLEAARKVQDIIIQAKEKELQYTRQIGQEQIKLQELADQKASFNRGFLASISSDPASNELLNTVETALEKWRTGRRSVEEEYAQKQQEIQLNAQKAEIAIQRYKFDNALKIARANEESQLKINRMQEQINKQNAEVSKTILFDRAQIIENEVALIEYQMKLREAAYKDAMLQVQTNTVTLTPYGKEKYALEKTLIDQAKEDIKLLKDQYTAIYNRIDTMRRISPVGPAPRLTNPSAPVTDAMSEAERESRAYEEQLNLLTRARSLKQEELELAKSIVGTTYPYINNLNQILATQKQTSVSTRLYREELQRGVVPAIAQELAKIKEVGLEAARIQLVIDRLRKSAAETKNLSPEDKKTLDEILAKLELAKTAVGAKTQEAIAGVFANNMPGDKLKTFALESMAALNDLESVALRVSQSIGDSLASSVTGALTGILGGTKTAKEAFAEMLNGISRILMEEATKMIATYIAIGLAKQFAGILGGGAAPSRSLNFAGINQYASQLPVTANAMGGIYGNGIQPFARGGIVNSPTLFKFAKGGAMRTGLMGEAGPEAVMPLTRGPGGRLGVDASGSGSNVSVTVNVDASGSKVSGDNQQAGQLGRVVSAAVQQEIARQKRPGGLLA